MRYAEAQAINRGVCPSPFADAVARMIESGVSLETTAGFFRISPKDASALAGWVSATKERAAA